MGMTEAPLQDWACEKAEEAGWYHRKLKWVGRRHAHFADKRAKR